MCHLLSDQKSLDCPVPWSWVLSHVIVHHQQSLGAQPSHAESRDTACGVITGSLLIASGPLAFPVDRLLVVTFDNCKASDTSRRKCTPLIYLCHSISRLKQDRAQDAAMRLTRREKCCSTVYSDRISRQKLSKNTPKKHRNLTESLDSSLLADEVEADDGDTASGQPEQRYSLPVAPLRTGHRWANGDSCSADSDTPFLHIYRLKTECFGGTLPWNSHLTRLCSESMVTEMCDSYIRHSRGSNWRPILVSVCPLTN